MSKTIYTSPAKMIHTHFPEIRRMASEKKFRKSPLYQNLKPLLKGLIDVCECENFVSPVPGAPGTGAPPQERQPVFKAVSWNIERGMVFDGVVDVLKNHPEISKADLFFIPETDVGMARSRNRNVAKELALSLDLNYAFTPCYINLDKGNGPEAEIAGGLNNEVGLHGNAILSRWPISNPRQVVLKNCKDKMRGREKRIGSQRSLVVDIDLPGGPLRAVCLHLDAHSSPRQRCGQMKTVVEFLSRENFDGPTLLGGDFNTSTYYASHAFFAFFSFWRKVAMGAKYVCENHYPFPEKYFERDLFNFLENSGFDYKNFNAIGVPTMHYHMDDEVKKKNMRDWTPQFFQFFVDWAMKKAQGLAQFKIDWFVGKNLESVANSQKVLGNLLYQGNQISDHDAIAVDFKMA